jgi:RNA polymerase sigma factor (sigma-70 family)
VHTTAISLQAIYRERGETMPDDAARRLRVTIQGFLTGDSAQYRIIRAKVAQYVHHQPFNRGVDVEEIVSETVRILYENLKQGAFRGDSLTALSAYIYSICRHQVHRAWHRQKRLVSMDHPPELMGPDEGDQQAQRDLTARVLSALAESCRKLIELKFLQGWTNDEIAVEMGKTKNAISTAISRCIKKVAEFDFVRESL